MRQPKALLFNVAFALVSLFCIASWTWFLRPKSLKWIFPGPTPEEQRAAEQAAAAQSLWNQLPTPVADFHLFLDLPDGSQVQVGDYQKFTPSESTVTFDKKDWALVSLMMQMGTAQRVTADSKWKSIGETLIYKEKGGSSVTIKVYETAKGLGFQINGQDYESGSGAETLMDVIHEAQKPTVPAS